MGRTAKIVGGFRPPIPGPTSTGPDCSSGTSNFAGSTSSSTSTGPDCSSGTSNFAGSTSSSGPTDRSIDNYACDFPSGRTGAHPNLTSAILNSPILPGLRNRRLQFSPSLSHVVRWVYLRHALNQPNSNTHNCNPAPAPNHMSSHLLPGLPHRDT